MTSSSELPKISLPSCARWRDAGTIAAGCVLGGAGWGVYQALPVVLGALAEHRGFDNRQVGWLGGAELTSMLAGGICAALLVAGGRRLRLAMVGLTLVLGALLATGLASSFQGTMLARIPGGFGAGLLYSICVSCLADTAIPARSFGILNAVMVVFAAIQLATFPLIDSVAGLGGVLWVLAAECLVAAAVMPLIRVPDRSTEANPSTTDSAEDRWESWAYIAATAIFHIAPAMFWTYCERLGNELGLTATFIGSLLTVASLAAALLCVISWRFSERWGERRCLRVAGGLLALSLLSWALPASGMVGYAARTALFFLTWGVAGVFQQSGAARLGSAERMTTLIPVAQNAGLAVGPVVGALLISAGLSLSLMLVASAGFVVLSLIIYALIGARTAVKSHAVPATSPRA